MSNMYLPALAEDARHRWLPMLLVSTLCFVQDYFITNVLGIPRTFARFAVWNALYTFGWVWITKKRCKSFLEASYVFGGNCVHYAAAVFLRSLLASASLVWLFIPLIAMAIIAVEGLHFFIFDHRHSEKKFINKNYEKGNDEQGNEEKEAEKHMEKYVIRVPKKAIDSLLLFVASFMFAISAWNSDCRDTDLSGQWHVFLMFVPSNILLDLGFGIPHNLSHRIPWLWKRHKIHHEYRDNELNTFANTYSDLLDGFMMLYVIAVDVFVDQLFGVPIWHMIDSNTLALFTHHKYAHKYIGLIQSYEMDIALDILMGHKLAGYHREHHVQQQTRFAAYGLVSDASISAIGNLLVKPLKAEK